MVDRTLKSVTLSSHFNLYCKLAILIKSWLSWIKRRNEPGAFHQVVQEMLTEDKPVFQNYFQMNKEKLFELVRSLQPTISKQDTVLRESIKADNRVAVTLRYLVTGETFSSLETQFWIHRTTISETETHVLHSRMEPTYFQEPSEICAKDSGLGLY